MEQEILNRIIFCGKIVEDLHKKIKVYEDELTLEKDKKRISAIKKQISSLKATMRKYKTEQKVLTFEN